MGGRGRSLFVGVLVLGMLSVAPLAGASLDPGGSFSDDNGSIHEGAIEAIAADGITKGCNPPINDLYCPISTVTRQQMASFMVRALDLPAGTADFTDIDGSIHKADIAALAAAGVTRGCNPPVNDLFCPTATVTRQQMASFLVRALDLPAGTATFTDVGTSIHAADISALASAGITKGCNPPANDMFCPTAPVTREQMASFLSRALGLTPMTPPPPLPDESPSNFVVIGSQNWLYFAETIDQTCLADSVYDRLLVEIDKAATVVTASGRDFVYSVPPNKAVVYPTTVPSGVWDGSCAQQNSDALHYALVHSDHEDQVGLIAPFLAATDQLYFKHDTHWNVNGSLRGAELIADKAAPGVWDQLDLVASAASRQGDLADLIDVDWVIAYDEQTPTLSGVEPTVTVESIAISGRPLVTYASPSSPELSSTATVVIHDSFGLFFRNKLGPLFEDVTFLPTFSHPIPDAARPFVAGSDQIIIEVVERNVLRDFIGGGTAGHLAAALADDFVQTPVTFNRVGEAVDFTIPSGAPGALRYLVIDADVASTVILDDLNEVDIPLTEAAWPNELTADASRYGFEVVDSGGTLRLALPSSVDVTAAFVVVIE